MGVCHSTGFGGSFFFDKDSMQKSTESSRSEKGGLSREEILSYAQFSSQQIIDKYGFWNEKKVFDLGAQALDIFSDCYRSCVGEEGLKQAKSLYRRELFSLLAGPVMDGRLSFFTWNQALIDRIVKKLRYDQPINDLVLKAQNAWQDAFNGIKEHTTPSDMGGATIEEIENISLSKVKQQVESQHIQDSSSDVIIKG